jgi:Flp pilus assembly protein TadG/Mg-chelatase subunit ChlD
MTGDVLVRWIRSLKLVPGMRWVARDETGQSLIIIVLAIVALIAAIGLGVDLGLVYIERGRMARAMDAAALAGAQELPSEEAGHQRALEYLVANGYDVDTACIETLGSDLKGAAGSCSGSEAGTIIIIDTLQFRRDGQENTADRINVRATQDVPLTFLRVIGYDTVPVSANATGENIDDLDIALVYDRSGSMQEDTRCYGCWEPIPGQPYRVGTTYPLPSSNQCAASAPLDYEGYSYLSIEAEHYTRYLVEADYHRDRTEFPKIWWAMQRESGRNASGPDARGAFMKVGPHMHAAVYYENLGNIVYPPNFLTTPRLDYDFTVPVAGTYYVWMRAQGGTNLTDSWVPSRVSRRRAHFGFGGVPMATGYTCFWGPYNDGASSSVRKNSTPPSGNCTSTNDMGWSWSRVLTLSGLQAGHTYVLNVWAAGVGFSLDKIVITNDPRTDLDRNDRPLDWSYNGIDDGGPSETHGRTGWACMYAEDPRFAPIHPETGALDDLYDDYQPIRAAKEAAKDFVRRLNPELDQIAYIWYNHTSEIREELYCLKQGIACADFERVVDSIESTSASGSTDIADALWDGIRVLTTGVEPNPSPSGSGFPPKQPGTRHYGRPTAAHILVLMTDGQANDYPTLPTAYGNCYSSSLWPDQPGEMEDQRRGRECMAWFALQARDQGIVIYTIGLGQQADHELLNHIADLTGGWYYFAPSVDELESVFESLYERIFLRLTD